MIRADVLITNKIWKKYIKFPEHYINKKLKKIEKKTKIFKKNSFNFTLLLSGNLEVKKLNIKFRKKISTTDILSFPFNERKILKKLLRKCNTQIYLGDIIINLNKIKQKKKNESFNLVFDKMWVHGLTHLLGYRHKSNFDYSIMKKLENKLLKFIE